MFVWGHFSKKYWIFINNYIEYIDINNLNDAVKLNSQYYIKVKQKIVFQHLTFSCLLLEWKNTRSKNTCKLKTPWKES